MEHKFQKQGCLHVQPMKSNRAPQQETATTVQGMSQWNRKDQNASIRAVEKLGPSGKSIMLHRCSVTTLV